MKNDKWKLHSLPTLQNLNCSSAYFNCALYMRNSLTQLDLEEGMIARRDYDRLLEFKNLIKIRVGHTVLRDIYDCSTLLKHAPQIKELELKGF
jgi:hypothetical protein